MPNICIVYTHVPKGETDGLSNKTLDSTLARISRWFSWGDTMVIVSVNHCWKEFDVQSCPCGDIMLRSGGGSRVGICFTCGLERMNCSTLFLDSISALKLFNPAMCSATIIKYDST